MSKICYTYSSPNIVNPLKYTYAPLKYGPCDPWAGSISLCCGVGHTCLTNGLCVTQSGIHYSGGCTDSTYEAAICPQYCTSGDANWVVQCPSGAAVKAGDFCCSVNETARTCCDTASNGLGLGAAVLSAQALSAVSMETRGAPASASSGATITSSRNITDYIPCPEELFDWNTALVMLILALLAIVSRISYLAIIKIRQQPQRPQRPQNGIFQSFKAVFTYPLDSYRARRQTRRNEPGPRHPEADGDFELQSFPRRRGSRSVPSTQRGVVAENQGSETNPEETDADGTHGQDPRATTDDNSLTEPPAEAREFT